MADCKAMISKAAARPFWTDIQKFQIFPKLNLDEFYWALMIIKWPVTAIPVGEKALPKCYCGEVFNHLVKWKMSKADFNTATKLISVLVFLSNFPRTIKCAVWVKPHHVAATTAQTALDTYLKWLDRKGHFCKTSRILPNTGWGKSVAHVSIETWKSLLFRSVHWSIGISADVSSLPFSKRRPSMLWFQSR